MGKEVQGFSYELNRCIPGTKTSIVSLELNLLSRRGAGFKRESEVRGGGCSVSGGGVK